MRKLICIVYCFFTFLEIIGCTLLRSEDIVTTSNAIIKCEGVGYETIYEAIEFSQSRDTLIVLKDIEVDRTIRIVGKDITLTSHGDHHIFRSANFKGNLFFVAENAELHLSSMDELQIDGNEIEVDSSLIKNEGKLFMEGPNTILCNNYVVTETAGGAVWNSGQFQMDGGIIKGNRLLWGGKGSGIYSEGDGSCVIIKGGKIFANWAIGGGDSRRENGESPEAIGGGIACEGGSIIMEGGEVCRNSSNRGGGVYCNHTRMVIKGGKIYENDAGRGGGIFFEGTKSVLTIEKGEIYNNSAILAGGGICNKGGKILLRKGKIYNNCSHFSPDGGIFSQGDFIQECTLHECFYGIEKNVFDNKPTDGWPPPKKRLVKENNCLIQ